MKEFFLFRKAKLFSTKLLEIVFLIFVAAFGGYCQSGKPHVDISEIYKSEIKRLLLPSDSLVAQTPVVAAFMVHPEIYPDYSFCLKDSARQFYLEMRLLDKNLWYELLTRFMQKQSLTLPLRTSIYSTLVSKKFKKKIIQAFDRISPVKKDPNVVYTYDGTTYEFIWVKDGEMKKIPFPYGVKAESYEYKLINLLELILSDLKKNSFTESMYIKKLDFK